MQGLQEPMANNGFPLCRTRAIQRLGHGDVVLLPRHVPRHEEDPGVGTAFDRQKDYRAYASDVFVDYPFGRGAITGSSITTVLTAAHVENPSEQNDVLSSWG